MGSLPMMPGQAGGMATGGQNAGIPVLGNSAGRNQTSPPIGNGAGAVPSSGVAAPTGSTGGLGMMPQTGYKPSNGLSIGNQKQSIAGSGSKALPLGSPSVANAGSGTGAIGTPTGGGTGTGALQGLTTQQQQQVTKQLKDIYGKGEGSLLGSLLNNLGSNNSSYMQAYTQAMAKQNQEGFNTLQTAQGNAGIGADSSTAAIADSNYWSGVTAQEGLQEQQLQMAQIQDTMGLVTGMEHASQQEVSSGGWLNTISQLVGAGTSVANTVSDIMPGWF